MDEPDKKPSGVPTWFLVVTAAFMVVVAAAIISVAYANYENQQKKPTLPSKACVMQESGEVDC